MKIGLKLWSTNTNRIAQALLACKKGLCDYIELFYVPGSLDLLRIWEKLDGVPFIVHAPHSEKGLNPADANSRVHNAKLAEESFAYAKKLHADFVIFHPGMAGSLEEAARQIKTFGAAARILIENKPYQSIHEPVLPCRGYSPDEIIYLTGQCGTGFCLDIGHAICAANSVKQDALAFVDAFISLEPRLYHLSDGDFASPIDSHLNLGRGNYPLTALLNKIPENSMLTVETDKNHPYHLDDFEEDVRYLRNIQLPGRGRSQ